MAVDAGGDSTTFWGAAAGILVTALGVLIQQFFKGKKEEAKPAHYVIEQAEIADLSAIRDLARQFGPALEKLTALDHHNREAATRFETSIREILHKLDTMERAAQVAKEVREELARRTGELERRDIYRRDRNHDSD
jgi:hypothetical protein